MVNTKRNKSAILCVAVVAALATAAISPPAEARLGSGSGSSSSSRSASSPSYSRPSPTVISGANTRQATSPSRLSGGGSIGMQRSQISQNVRSGNTQPTINGKSTTPPSVPGNNQNQYGQSRPYANNGGGYPYQDHRNNARGGYYDRSGNWIAPALAGAAAGYLIGDHNSNHAPSTTTVIAGGNGGGHAVSPEQAPNVVNVPGEVAAPAPIVVTTSTAHESGTSVFASLLWMLVFLGIGYVIWRKMFCNDDPHVATGVAKISNDMEAIGDDLLARAPSYYRNLQQMNNTRDLAGLRKACTDDIYQVIADDINQRGCDSGTQIVSLEAKLADITYERGANRYVGSVQYKGSVRESVDGPIEAFEEIYHFIKENQDQTWRLAGIEQV